MGIAIVGSRTTRDRGARGRGITLFDTGPRPWQPLGEVECVNPSFLAAGRLDDHYVVHGDRAEVSRVIVSGGVPSLVQTVDSGGTNPVHLTLDASGSWLLVVNHSGSVVSLPVAPDGSLGPVAGRLDLTGRPGPHTSDQGRAKPHQIVPVPGTTRFLVPDKGLDTVFTLHLDAGGALFVAHEIRLRELAGPRHVALHPTLPNAYTIDELASTVSVLRLDADARPTLVQVHSTLDPDDVRDSRGGEVAVSDDGRWVYASNRSGAGDRTPGGPGDDTVACFPVLADGRLGRPTWVSTGGVRPRFMTWHDGRLIVANERTDTIVALKPAADGRLGAPQTLAETGSPVCVVFA